MYLGRSIAYSVKLFSEKLQIHVRVFSESVISLYPSRDVICNSGLLEGYRWKSQLETGVVRYSRSNFNYIFGSLYTKLCCCHQYVTLNASKMAPSVLMSLMMCLFQVWCDWLLCHSAVWNPPPSCIDYRVG
jgi:hypothetical protein